METQAITIPPAEARVLWRKYQQHLHYSTPIDREIATAYKLMAQGKLVIDAVASIKAAGVDELLRPKLAIVRADAKTCFWRTAGNGGAGSFSMKDWARHPAQEIVVRDWPAIKQSYRVWKAIAPIIPIDVRPKRGLQNYHILFEADWESVPIDPMLLRRIGRSDLWVVHAMWDLTAVERAVLKSRALT